MKKQVVLSFAFFILAPLTAHAQGGCVNSPENPTIILGLVGSTAGVISYLCERASRKQ